MKLVNNALLLGALSLTGTAHADWFDAIPSWSFSGAMGITTVDNMLKNEGESAIGRISIQKYITTSDVLDMGLELSLQNGNTMKMDIPQYLLDKVGGLPIELTLKPTIDLLISAKINNLLTDDIFLYAKAGVAYRRAQVDRITVNNLSVYHPEAQIGLGYLLNDKLNLFLGYQHIFGKDPAFSVNDETETASIKNIPSQKSILFGVSFLF